jgi:hypothetical protein
MRSASARVRLPNTSQLGPRISVDGGAPQGTKGGCDRANEYAEGMLRVAARAHGPTTHYRYSALVPTPTGLAGLRDARARLCVLLGPKRAPERMPRNRGVGRERK